jgi:hypothetical protein
MLHSGSRFRPQRMSDGRPLGKRIISARMHRMKSNIQFQRSYVSRSRRRTGSLLPHRAAWRTSSANPSPGGGTHRRVRVRLRPPVKPSARRRRKLPIIIHPAIHVVMEIPGLSSGRSCELAKRRHGTVNVLLRKAKYRDVRDHRSSLNQREICSRSTKDPCART